MLQPGMLNDAFHGYVAHLARDSLLMDAKFTYVLAKRDVLNGACRGFGYAEEWSEPRVTPVGCKVDID